MSILKSLLSEQTKIIIRYYLRRHKNASKEVKTLLSAEQYLSFDDRSRTFFITNEKLTINELVAMRRTLKDRLTGIRPLTSVKIDDIITGYYDKCLERYLYERLNRLKSNEDTCWFNDAQNNKCVGWVDNNSTFGLNEKREFLYGPLKSKIDIDKEAELLERDPDGYIFKRSNDITKEDDKVLSLYRRIKEKGFSNIESSLVPIILGYSQEMRLYNPMTGRHRIAVLRYMRSQGMIGNIRVRCHIVKYPFESIVYTRPYTELCKRCAWGEVYDPGKGTHQDFYVREGIAVMRGRKNKKGGRQKWDRIQPIFKEAVLNRSVIDVGAHRGLYCLKALEYGAKHVTAFDHNTTHTEIIDTVRIDYALGDLNLIKGDFYNDDDYDFLVKNRYDTIILLGTIHHFLRIGIQKDILYSFDELFQRISKFVNYGIIVEFAMPTEVSLNSPEIFPYRDAFSKMSFEKALRKYFPKLKNLGRCKYHSGKKHGRFMYYGIKK